MAGWQAVTASVAYLTATQIQGLVVLTHPTFVPKPWQTMLLFWAVLFSAVFINCFTNQALARLERGILILHLAGFVAVLVPLVCLGPHGDGSVFTTFLNEGAWPTQPLSFFVGLPAAVFSLVMSEEIQRASIIVPRTIILSTLINGLLGFGMVLGLIFCIGDVQAALAAQETLGYPFLEIFRQAVKSVAGTCLMFSDLPSPSTTSFP
ncbi:MAG: hypothetical protein Q9191_000117 [Dirinaria sp. TL-2023a]